MSRSKKLLRRSFAAVVVAPLLSAWSVAAAQVVAPGTDVFLREASAALGVPADTIVLGDVEGPLVLEDAGLSLFVRSAVASDRKQVVALTAAGLAIDFAAALELNQLAAAARRGKFAQRLHQELLTRPLDQRLSVVVWLNAPDVGPVREEHARRLADLDAVGDLTREAADALRDALATGIRGQIEPVTRAAAERFAAAGLVVVDYDVYAPIVFLSATAEELVPLLDDAEVASLDFAGMEYADRLNVAIGEVRANTVWTAPGGVTGVGAKVSIVESGRVCSTNPYMTVSATRNSALGVSSHTTGVGSCVASTHPTYKGVAPGATLISANGADFTANTTNVTTQMPGSVSAVSWSVTNGAHIMNLSYGAGSPGSTVSSFDKYLDYIARNSAKTIVVAAGNSGAFAGDPGAGYNQVAVGAFNDAGSTAWSGESMASFSSWQNPSTGVETPQVAGPGVSVSMLTCASPWTGYTASGTSFSSPITAGAAALVVAKSAALGSWPEAVRAILMATAWHNIEGAARLSSRDGAGGVDALAAFRVTARGQNVGYNFGTLTATSFDAGGFVTVLSATGTAGQTLRVCLSYDSTPSAGPTYSPDTLKADFDLYVYNPSGTLAASSIGALQPFEIVHFAAAQTGTYTVRIKRNTFTGTSEYYGVAFSTSADQ